MNKDYIQIIRDGVNHSFTVTKNKFIDAFNKGKEAVNKGKEAVNKAVNETVSNVKEAATKVKEAATKENIKKAYNKGKEAVKETVTKENIKKAYNKGKEAVQETISDVKENIKTFHLIIKENDYNFGKMLMKPGKALIEEAKKKLVVVKNNGVESIKKIKVRLDAIRTKIKNFTGNLNKFVEAYAKKTKGNYMQLYKNFNDNLNNIWKTYTKSYTNLQYNLKHNNNNLGKRMAQGVFRIFTSKKPWSLAALIEVSKWLDANIKDPKDRKEFEEIQKNITEQQQQELDAMREESITQYDIEYADSQTKKEIEKEALLKKLEEEDNKLKAKIDTMEKEDGKSKK